MRIRLLISVAIAAAAMALASPASAGSPCAPSTGSPWSNVGTGLSTPPSYVSHNPCTERRLRLLSALPGIQQSVAAEAKTYFGSQGPSLAVGIVLFDGLYYSDAYGPNDATPSGAPDEYTIFGTGSFSKVITGTALLTLTDDPKSGLTLQTKADTLLPELDDVCGTFDFNKTGVCNKCLDPKQSIPCVRSDIPKDITLDNLVSHTDGLPDVMEQNNATPDAWKADLKKAWLLFPLGTASAYSGIDAESVGLIEQRAVKTATSEPSYPDFIQKHLFGPLEMTHSSMDDATLTSEQQAHVATRWNFVGNPKSWTFTPVPGTIYQPDQVMLLPAGGFVSDIQDMATFITMFLSGNTPPSLDDPSRQLISQGALSAALQQQNMAITSTAAPPSDCANSTSFDTNSPPPGFFYRRCEPSNDYGVNWILDGNYVWHNGEFADGGSQTVLDPGAAIAATALMSTDTKPSVPAAVAGQPAVEPPGLDPGFIDTVVWTSMIGNVVSADQQTSTWAGQPLPEGVARLLWLSGQNPPAGAGTPIAINVTPPTPTTPLGHPVSPPVITPPKNYIKLGNFAVSPQLLNYLQLVIEPQFSPAERQHLGPVGIYFLLQNTFEGANQCSTFRVRHVHSSNDITIRLLCKGGNNGNNIVETRISTEPNGVIAGLAGQSQSSGQF